MGVKIIMTAGVCTTLMSTTLAGPRLACEMANREGFVPWLARRSTKSGVPVRATVVQGLMASVLVATGTFQDLLEWTTGVMLFFGACLGVAHLRLRSRDKKSGGDVEVFLDPLFPASSVALIFLCTGILVAAVVKGEAWHMVAGLVVVSCGLPIHRRLSSRSRSPD